MAIYTLPEREVFDRYYYNLRLKLMQGYHIKLAKKSNYFVTIFDNEQGYTNGYYTDGKIESIYHDNSYCIKDCKWIGSQWHIKPLITYVSPIINTVREEYYNERTTPLTEYGYNKDMIGLKVNGIWKWKTVTIKRSKWSDVYFTYDFKYDTFKINDSKAGRFGINLQGCYEIVGGLGTVKTNQLKKFNNNQSDSIEWIIDKLQQKHYKGFYDDVIEKLKEI